MLIIKMRDLSLDNASTPDNTISKYEDLSYIMMANICTLRKYTQIKN